MTPDVSTCPGCGLEMPLSGATCERKFHSSSECWALFEEVLAVEFQDPALFAASHQLTVDTYAVQHAGGRHPDKSVCIHLVGLYLVLEKGVAPTAVPPLLQRLATRASWPHLLPESRARLTVYDVAAVASSKEHGPRVREWGEDVWQSWSAHHGVVRELAKDLIA